MTVQPSQNLNRVPVNAFVILKNEGSLSDEDRQKFTDSALLKQILPIVRMTVQPSQNLN
ncbi:hypothetical protein GS399_19110 [Pedobacter sp. HMF7647]|uniref:Uncharacterized protein n=1 Tax=Hufsiella arboris TaxID=2695275 RepID=A0A7K1YEQ7_9SPHI|nr:hypothetical protein [Hufsiella arboris]MXV53085.1 hypothetical protein [Hufsiella arboris]